MASTQRAEPPTSVSVSSPAAASKLQASGHHKKKQKRISAIDVQQLGSMCEVPYSAAAPIGQLAPSQHGINAPQQPETVGLTWQQHGPSTTSDSSCYDGGRCQPGARCTCSKEHSQSYRPRRSPVANGGSACSHSSTSGSSSSGSHHAVAGADNSSQRHETSNGSIHLQSSGRSNSGSTDEDEMNGGIDAWRRRKAVASNGDVKKQDRQSQQDASAPSTDSNSQHHTATGVKHSTSIPPRVNGYIKGHGPKQHSSSLQQQQPPESQQVAGLPSSAEQQGWVSIQFGDLPPVHQLGTSPASEDTSAHLQSRRGSNSRLQTVVAKPGLETQRSHSADVQLKAPDALVAAMQVSACDSAEPQHQGKKVGLVNGKHGGKLEADAADATSAAAQQQQLVSELQSTEQQHPDSAPSTPQRRSGLKGSAAAGPRSPQLSPQLLEQFGLQVAPLNGYILPNEMQLRAAIEQAGVGVVLVARADEEEQEPGCVVPQVQQSAPSSAGPAVAAAVVSKSSSPDTDVAPSVGAGKASSLQQTSSAAAASVAATAVATAAAGSSDKGKAQQKYSHAQHLQVQVPDTGVDDCSIASSGSSSVHTSSTTSNPWQQQESAAAALRLGRSRSGLGSSIGGRGGHSQQPAVFGGALSQQQPIYLGRNNSPLLQQHVDQSDIMSDPGTVPGGAPFQDEGYNGYSRMKPGRNRFVQHHHIGGPYGGRHHVQDQPMLMQQLAGGGNSSSSSGRGGRGGSNSNSRDYSNNNDGSSHGNGGDRNADRGGRGGGGGSSRDADGGGSGSGGRRGGDRGNGRRNSKGNSLDYAMPRSPQLTGVGNRRSFDTRGGMYEDRRGGGRHTPLPSPGGRSSRDSHRGPAHSEHSSSRADLRDIASPFMAGSSSAGTLGGHPSPLMLPEPALNIGPSSSRGLGVAAIDLPPAAAAGSHPNGMLTDLERLLAATGPTVPVNPAMPLQQVLEGLTLKSVWDLFLEPSLWGTPVNTLGGPRGPSTAYYVPFMSAMQLFTTVTDVPPPSSSAAASNSNAGSSSSSDNDSNTGSPVSSSRRSSSSSAFCAAAGTQAAANNSNLRSPSGTAAAAAAATTAAAAPVGPGGRGRLHTCAVKGWPTVMRLLLEHMEQELPFSRDPFYIQLEAMAGGAEAVEAAAAATAAATAAAATGTTAAANSTSESAGAATPPAAAAGGFTACGYPLVGAELMATRLMDVHPASWFAVAWYPVYRIPDAPLTARFLSFYSFSQLLEVLNEAVSAAKADLAAPCRLAGLPMPVVGMKWYNLMGERWLELFASPVQTMASSSKSRNKDNSPQSSSGEGEQQMQRVQMHSQRFKDWQARLQDLQGVAERLSKGSGLKVLTPQGPKEVRLYHSDYEFFNSRG